MSLRVRLVLVVLVLTGVGLVVSGVATSSALRSYLLQRVDQRLADLQPFAVRRLTEPAVTVGPAPGEVISAGAGTPPKGANGDVLAARYDPSGKVVRQFVPPFSNAAGIVQAVPVAVLAPARSGRTSWSEETIAGVHYRVVVEPIGSSS